MTGFDVTILVLVGTGAVLGFARGFVQEVLALAAWLFAMVAIHNLHTPLSHALLPYIETQSGAAVLAFALLMLIPYGITKLIANKLGGLSRNSALGAVDRALGFGFGAVKGMVIVVLGFSILVLGYDTIWGAAGRPTWMTRSRSYPFVNASSDALVKMLGARRAEAASQSNSSSDGNN